jgi:uracil-DNA glycosylase
MIRDLKKLELDKLKEKMANDQSLPLRSTATNLVFGEGSLNPKVYFLGEAPGRHEDLSGRPFVGQAGKLLDKLLTSIGLTREDVYITSVVRFRPPNNRQPTTKEIETFAPFVDEEIKIIKPKIIATLGRFAMEKFLVDKKISQVHGQLFNIKYQGLDIILIPLYHPAAGLRSTKVKNMNEEDFQRLGEVLK